MCSFIVLEAKKSEIKVSGGLYSLWRLQGRICSLPFPALVAANIP